MEWKKFHHLPTDKTEWRLILDTITMDEKTVGLTIRALQNLPEPTELYWALVGAVTELGELKRKDAAGAEKARRRQRWEDAKWSTDPNGFETSGSAKADGFDFAGGGSFDRFAEAMRRAQEEMFHRAAYGRASGDAKREAPRAKTNYTGRDWWVVIGCSQSDARPAINAAYRKRAMEIHSQGLGEDALKELNVAKDLAFKLVLS